VCCEGLEKAWKGLAAIKHKVVRRPGRLNPFPAFSPPPPAFCPVNLFTVSSFVPQISLSGRGPPNAGAKNMHNERAVTTTLLLDVIQGDFFHWASPLKVSRAKVNLGLGVSRMIYDVCRFT